MLYDPSSRFSNSKKASSRKPTPGGLYLGTVVRVGAQGVFVNIPKVAAQTIFGPCTVFCTYPIAGQKVLCGFLDNRFEEVVILGRETTSKIIKEVETPATATDAANKSYVDSVIQNLKNYVDQNFD
jgi:hypothetical protein